MCGRFALHVTSQELANGTACAKSAGFRKEARYNIAPGQWMSAFARKMEFGFYSLSWRSALVSDWTLAQ